MRILFFSAGWCAPCKMFKPVVEKVCNEKGLDFEAVSVEENSDLARQHNVKSVPTLIFVDGADVEILRSVSVMPEAALRDVLEGLQ